MSLQRCVEQPDHGSTALDQVQQSLWTKQDESSIGFQRRNDSQDHLHIQAQACTASHSHVGQEEISEAEELGAILQPGC